MRVYFTNLEVLYFAELRSCGKIVCVLKKISKRGRMTKNNLMKGVVE
jgi:hypothetical protein